jgi:hypothetical protein
MAWPPPTLAINRTDATPQQTTHAADHNAANLAINDIVARIGTIPRGVVGWAGKDTEQTGIQTAPVALVGMSVTWTAAAGRHYLIQSMGTMRKSGADTAADVELWVQDGAAAQYGDSIGYCPAIAYNTMVTHAIYVATTAGSKIVAMYAKTAAGYVNVSRMTLTVVDVGGAALGG